MCVYYLVCVATGVCVYYCSTYYKAVREGGNGGHVLRETTSQGRCELVCPSRTNERGGEGYCVKEGEGEEGERESVCVFYSKALAGHGPGHGTHGRREEPPPFWGHAMSSSRRMPGENLKGPIVGDFESIAELREHLYQRCQNRCKTRAHAKQLVLT